MDHDRVSIMATGISCGVLGISRISDDVEGALYQVASRMYHPSRGDPCAAFVFSDIDTPDPTHSDHLIQFINERGLGVVETSDVMENPKTGNIIVIHTWIVDHEIFKAWYRERRQERLGKVGT